MRRARRRLEVLESAARKRTGDYKYGGWRERVAKIEALFRWMHQEGIKPTHEDAKAVARWYAEERKTH